ncbi:MAG: glycosyltransferase family 4 protein [Pseudomonadota bacterium]
MRVLCLDIEGGFGGSSRSLYESLRFIGPDFCPEVWCRKAGPAQQRYSQLDIPSVVHTDMPHISSLPLLSRNLFIYYKFAANWRRTSNFRSELAARSDTDFDLIHFNHEGLFLLAQWLRRALGSRITMTAHVRTHLPENAFTRWQYRGLANAVDGTVFITEMERNRVRRLVGKDVVGKVIYNIVSNDDDVIPCLELQADTRFKIASTSNFAYVRGTDRLVDVALELKKMSADTRFLIVVAGHSKLTGRMPGQLGEIATRGGTLADYAEARGVGHMFKFLGHVPDTRPYVSGCQALLRPSRGNDPWGREVLEAMALGVPVVSTGKYNRFVEDGVTGVLRSTFDAGDFAAALIRLADDQSLQESLGQTARFRVQGLCNGPDRAAELSRFWSSVVERKTKQ